MRSLARGGALLLSIALGACSDPEPIAVAGRVIDVDAFVGARLDGKGGAAAIAGAAVAGAQVTIAERPEIAGQTTGGDGVFAFREVPSRQRLHLVADAAGFCPSEDGIGLQFPESDVAGFTVGALPVAGFAAAVAATAGTASPRDTAMVVFLLMDSAPFPESAILADSITVSLQGGGRVVYGGWDPAARSFMAADRPDAFSPPAAFAGLVAVLAADQGTRIEFRDAATAGQRRPAFFLVYSVKPRPGRCVFYPTRAIASGA